MISWSLAAPLAVGKLRSRWVWIQIQWVQRKYGTMLWEDGDLAEKFKVWYFSNTVGLVDQVGTGPHIRPTNSKGNTFLKLHCSR